MPAAFRTPKFLTSSLIASLIPMSALAHPSLLMSADGAAGFLHPLTGIDHLLAMLAVGLLAARSDRSMWLLPTVFPFAMLVGAAMALMGIVLPGIEPMIALSVVVLGVMVVAGKIVSLPAGALIVAIFAIFHGHAHALEAPSSNGMLMYGAGFLFATLLLHAVGLVLGTALAARERAVALGGSAIAAAGLALLVT
jgi:urease accessory protein